jgi:molybdate transport system regulatory protein
MTNRYPVVVEACEPRDSIAWLRLGRGRIAARIWPGVKAGQKTTIWIPPQDVVLCEGHPGRTSARNVLPGHVRSVRNVPEGVHVTVDVGFPLTAVVTRRAARELELSRGRPLFALVKAAAVAPAWELTSRIRVSLVGRKGLLEPGQIDFLNAIDRTGSLSAAARELGITFRTAWGWARSLNEVWGSSLVARAPGGRGAGGTILTAEGRAAVRFAAKLERSHARASILRDLSTSAGRPGTGKTKARARALNARSRARGQF